MSEQDSEFNGIPKKRMGRPPKPKPPELKKLGAKGGIPVVEFIISINETERKILTNIAKAHNCQSISYLNRAIARGEITILKLNAEEFNSLKSVAISLKFNSLEDYLTAIATGSFSIPPVLSKPNISTPLSTSQIHTWTKRETPADSSDQTKTLLSEHDQLLLRALSLHHGFVVPSGKNSGDGSPSRLNRNIVQGNISLICLPPEIIQSLHLIAKSYDFCKLEDFLLSLIMEYQKPTEIK